MLKNYGYHLEHNFGHGQQYLALLRVMLNWLAFLLHTTLDLCDAHSSAACRRARHPPRPSSTTCKPCPAILETSPSWQALSNFMFTQRELDTDAPSPPRKRAQRR